MRNRIHDASASSSSGRSTLRIPEESASREVHVVLKEKLVSLLQSSKKSADHKQEVMNSNGLKFAHIYCKVNKLSGQVTGPLIELYIKNALNLKKIAASNCCGDLQILTEDLATKLCISGGKQAEEADEKEEEEKEKKKNIKKKQQQQVSSALTTNLEIKASNGGQNHNQFNYVQLRINHDCDYLFTAYYLCDENVADLGEMFAFLLRKKEVIPILARFGTYAHGTVKKLGAIKEADFWTLDTHEVNVQNEREYALRPKYGDDCWKALLKYRVDFE